MAVLRLLFSALPLSAAALLAGCATGPNSLDQQLLTPPASRLAEPADFGLAAEPFEIAIHGSASLTGFWIPHANGERNTVVLFHDADVDAGAAHPWYRLLHAAGFQVLVFDPRGYGRSKGQPTFLAWLHDLPPLFRWLRARADVDPQRIACYGTGLGSAVAMWAARTQHCQALVLEHLPSLRDILRELQGDDGTAFAAMRLGFTEFANLPEDIEPDDNAPHMKAPALFLASDGEPARDRKALLRTYGAYAGEKQLWMLQGTARAPHGMQTYGDEYAQQVAFFLRHALAGAPPILKTSAHRLDARGEQAVWQLTVEAPAAAIGPSAVPAIEVVAVLADGSAHFGQALMNGPTARVRLRLPSAPVACSAVFVPGALAGTETPWRRPSTPLQQAAAATAPLWPRIAELRHGLLPPSARPQLLADLEAAEAAAPFPPDLAVELADVFALLGKDLYASSDDSERAHGLALLQRAVQSRPARPELHVWHGPLPTYGWPQEDAVAMAGRLLAAPPK